MIDRTTTESELGVHAVAFRSRRDCVMAEGIDAADYLHGQLSQTVTGLADGASEWSLLLSPQGKVDAWLRVTRLSAERFLLDLDAGFGQNALDRLNRFKLRVAVELTLHELDWLAVRGPTTDEVRALVTARDDVNVVDLAWPDSTGFDAFGADLEIPDSLQEGPLVAFEALRIMEGRPRLGSEIVENTIPAEVGVVDLSADFTKGCYVGQELVARVDSRGNNTPRTMRRLRVDEPIEDLTGCSLLQHDTDVGVVTSSALLGTGTVVLASVKRAADLAAPFAIATPGAAVAALLVD